MPPKQKRLRKICKGSSIETIPAITTGSILGSFGLLYLIYFIIERMRDRGVVVPENIIEEIENDIETAETSLISTSPEPSIDTDSLIDIFDNFEGDSLNDLSSHSSSYYNLSPSENSSRSPSTTGSGIKTKTNKWIDHVKKYAKKHKITYFQALKEPKCKLSYKKISGGMISGTAENIILRNQMRDFVNSVRTTSHNDPQLNNYITRLENLIPNIQDNKDEAYALVNAITTKIQALNILLSEANEIIRQANSLQGELRSRHISRLPINPPNLPMTKPNRKS